MSRTKTDIGLCPGQDSRHPSIPGGRGEGELHLKLIIMEVGSEGSEMEGAGVLKGLRESKEMYIVVSL